LVSVESTANTRHLAANANPANPASLPNKITPPGTIWNPYVVKTPPAPAHEQASSAPSSPTKSENEDDSFVTVPDGRSIRLYSAPGIPPQFSPAADPFAHLQALAQQGNFTIRPPVFPALPPIKAPTTAEKTEQKTDSKAPITKTANLSTRSSETIVKTENTTSPFVPSFKWLWIALAVFFGGVGLFCIAGTLLLAKLVFTKGIQLKAPLGETAAPSPEKLDTEPEESLKGISKKQLRPLSALSPSAYGKKHGSLGFSDTAVVNALDYTKITSPNLSAAVRQNWQIHFGWQALQEGGKPILKPETLTERYLKTGTSRF
jgi:hypothetical protein